MHDYRAIFLDIDGTLTQPGHSAPPASAVAAIASARRLGRRVFLCTGRCEAMLKPLLHCADFDGYVASSGGLVVVGSRDVFDCPMTPQEQAHVLTALSDNGVFRTVQTRMGAYCDEGFRDFHNGCHPYRILLSPLEQSDRISVRCRSKCCSNTLSMKFPTVKRRVPATPTRVVILRCSRRSM